MTTPTPRLSRHPGPVAQLAERTTVRLVVRVHPGPRYREHFNTYWGARYGRTLADIQGTRV